jgi:hypothetical protein
MHWGVRKNETAPPKANTGVVDPVSAAVTIYAVSFLAMYGSMAVAKTFDSGNARVLVNKGKRAVTFQKDGPQYNRAPALAKKNMSEAQIMQSVVAPINPGYGKHGTKQNCRRCTLAYEMRRRGMDVKATTSTMATGQHGTGLRKATGSKTKKIDWGENKVYPFGTNPKDRSSAPKAIFKRLSTQPNGSRGELGVGWKMGGGHSLAYEIVQGKPVIFDTQRGLKIKTAAELTKAYDLEIGAAAITRLDNKKLNEQWLERWVQNND